MSEFDPPEDYFDRDESGNIINGAGTYAELGKALFYGDPAPIFSWSDGEGTILDVALVWKSQQLTPLQHGRNAGTHLFVSVMDHGAAGFDISNGQWKSPDYIGEKLGLGGYNPTTRGLSDLINGVAGDILA